MRNGKTKKQKTSGGEIAPPTCPYCSRPSCFLPSSESIYHGSDFGPVYICRPCGAWVGCHSGTRRPLGRLADKELRDAKRAAHEAFDRTWRARLAKRSAVDPTYSKRNARASRYKLLASLLGVAPSACHIGMFDLQQCRRVVGLCRSGALDTD